MKELILHELSKTWDGLASNFAHFIPRLIVMLIIIAVGYLIAWALKVILRGVLRVVRFEKLSESAGTARLLNKASLPSSSELLTRFIFWIAWIGFILLGISALGILGLQRHISQIFLYLPHLLVALLIVFFGFVAASFFARAALLAAVNADAPSPRLISGSVKFVIVALAVAMAFEQLGLAEQTILAAFSILFGACMFSLAIAFGLGGQDLARRALERRFEQQHTEEREREPSPL
jgi:hypothetical protein